MSAWQLENDESSADQNSGALFNAKETWRT